MPIEQGAGWGPELVGADWRRVRTLEPVGNRTRICRLSSSFRSFLLGFVTKIVVRRVIMHKVKYGLSRTKTPIRSILRY